MTRPQLDGNVRTQAAASVFLSATGIVTDPGGVGFLFATQEVPLWFLLAAVALPTGDLLAYLRGWIPASPGESQRLKENDGGE